jgi:peptidoglycan/xylan/chitin deacetylase (PgdA/CDA1 family)
MVLGIILGAVGIMALGHTAPFPFIFDVAAKDISIWRVPPSSDRKVLYLTFDDGPNPTATPELLDLLREKHVRSTFFLIDAYVNETTAPIVRRMFEEGHAVGQHSGDRWLLLHTPDQLVEQFQAEASRLESPCGAPALSALSPAWRLAEHHNVARPSEAPLQARRLELDDLGLVLVSPANRTTCRVTSHLPRSGGQDHCDP